MKKLVKGVVDFREQVRPKLLDQFEKLALGQRPDTLLVTCSDSRVAVNVFASTNPGDLFVLRNIGNLVPPAHSKNESYSKAALDFAIDQIGINHILVCGHSECGAMIAVHQGLAQQKSDGLRDWLQYAVENTLAPHDYNELSRKNVLLQLEHALSFEKVKERFDQGLLQLHAWWFDIKTADVYYYSKSKKTSDQQKEWVLIDAEHLETLLNSL